MKHCCINMFLGRAQCWGSSCNHFIFCSSGHSVFEKSTPPWAKPCNTPSVQPCDSCFSCLRCGGTSPSRNDEDFAVSHSWTPYIHPAGTTSLFSFHMKGVTPHSCYNFSVVHKKSPLENRRAMCFEFSLCLFPFTASLPTFSSARSLTQIHTQTQFARLLALFLLLGPFSPHESVPFRCIWGYGCHWQPAVREWQPLSMLGVSRGAPSTQSSYWWRLLYGLRRTKRDGVCQRQPGESW